MKQYKKIIAAVAAAAILALPLSGCSFNDVMLYLYGGDSFTKEEGEDYQTYDGENGISVTYDANIWNEPSMSQEDTGGSGPYRRVLFYDFRCLNHADLQNVCVCSPAPSPLHSSDPQKR